MNIWDPSSSPIAIHFIGFSDDELEKRWSLGSTTKIIFDKGLWPILYSQALPGSKISNCLLNISCCLLLSTMPLNLCIYGDNDNKVMASINSLKFNILISDPEALKDLWFKINNPISPLDLLSSDDSRQIGFGVEAIDICNKDLFDQANRRNHKISVLQAGNAFINSLDTFQVYKNCKSLYQHQINERPFEEYINSQAVSSQASWAMH